MEYHRLAERKSISILAVEDTEQCHRNDLQIEGQAPVAQIVQIILHALCDRSVTPPAVHLCPAGDSDFEGVADIVFFDPFQMPFYKMGHFRTRSDNAHATPKHVNELRQFIKIQAAKNPSHPGAP